MNLLFDTHAYFWWETNDRRLSPRVREAVADEQNEVFVSAVTAWELATKVRIGKWPEAEGIARDIKQALNDRGFSPLTVTMEHALAAGFLPGRHGDPFDRMLAAQSDVEGISLVTADPVFKIFGTRVLW